MADLRQEVDRLYFISEALWRIVREKLEIPDDELAKMIARIDLEDGRLDGRKVAAAPANCPKCARVLGKGRPRCMFCGEPVLVPPFER